MKTEKTTDAGKGQLGVGSIKAAVVILIGLITTSIKNFADGIQGKDFIALIPKAMEAATNAGVFQNIGAEVKDGISQEEMAELITAAKDAFVKEELGIENEAYVDLLAQAVCEAAIANLKVIYIVKHKDELLAA